MHEEGNVLLHYSHGSYVDELLAIVSGSGGPTQMKYAHSNHLYSIAALTDNTGAVVERYRYGRQWRHHLHVEL